MLLHHWGLALCALASAVCASVLPDPSDFTNVQYVKTLELAGSIAHLTTTITFQQNQAIRSFSNQDGFLLYYLTFSAEEAHALSWHRVTIKPAPSSPLAVSGRRTLLETLDLGPLDNDVSTHIYGISVPYAALGDKESATLTFEATLNHLPTPLPAIIKQTEPQFLLWQGDAQIRSPYATTAGRIKVKAPHPKILSYEPEEATKSGAIVTFGPFEKVKAYVAGDKVTPGKVHYQHDLPVVSLVDFERVAELSHWGDNLAIEDRIWLRNDGPTLKGFFSRIEHQMSAFYRKTSSHALTNLGMHLPPGSRDAYFIDQIGNVSTSHFRPSKADPSIITTQLNLIPTARASFLELQPRFPLLGGWNYTFSVGWNMKMSEGGWLKRLGHGEYVVAVPFTSPVTDVAIDKVRTRIVLPEGARVVDVQVPFDVEQRQEITKTYLDTIGRTTVVLVRSRCSEKHGQVVYVRYTLTPLAHLRKPIAVSSIALGAFVLTGLLRRMDFRIR